ncbi:MAG: amino acid ABC transporter permease, partial [Notoacmeibacter sp.]|nr:amino acid ABC transporter permease [Notoacmeibacter sp.]
MASTELSGDRGGVSAASWFYDPKIRGIVYQVLVFVGLVAFVWWITNNTIENLRQANIASGYDFLNGRAGFDIGQTPIEYTSDSTYGRAFIVGMINTVIVAFFGILTATIVG